MAEQCRRAELRIRSGVDVERFAQIGAQLRHVLRRSGQYLHVVLRDQARFSVQCALQPTRFRRRFY